MSIHLLLMVIIVSVICIFTTIYLTVINNVWCRCGGSPILHRFDDTFYYACHNCGYIGKSGKTKEEAKKGWKP